MIMEKEGAAMSEWIAVMAGTPVDSEMGVDVLAQHGIEGRAYAMAADPLAQTAFQHQPQAEKTAVVRETLLEIRTAGCKRVLVYCNSLAGAVDFAPLAEETGLFIVTPLDAYRTLAQRYTRLGVIAANAQGLSGIERTLYAANPGLEMLGTTLLPVVSEIEAGEAPAAIVTRYRLKELGDWAESCGMEALLLGCTHFPYLKEALAEVIQLPLIDPADEMVRQLVAMG